MSETHLQVPTEAAHGGHGCCCAGERDPAGAEVDVSKQAADPPREDKSIRPCCGATPEQQQS